MLLVETGYSLEFSEGTKCELWPPFECKWLECDSPGTGCGWGQGREDPGGKVLTDSLRSAWSEP